MRSAPAAPTALRSNDPCWCGSGRKYKRCHKELEGRIVPGTISPWRTVPAEIERPAYADTGVAIRRPEPHVKSPEIIERMRRTGRSAAEVLALTGAAVRPGITTDELDAICHAALHRAAAATRARSTTTATRKSLCTSVNEVICHGIPDDRPLRRRRHRQPRRHVYLEGVHGDTNATFLVGDVDEGSQRLVRVTHECLMLGHRGGEAGRPLSDIGRAIERHATKSTARRRAGLHRPRHRRAVPHRPADPALLRPRADHGHASRA